MGLNAKQANQLTKIMLGLYKLFNEQDLALVELNPLAIAANGDLIALDGKVNSDDNAEFRHPKLAEMRDESQEDHAEAPRSSTSQLRHDGWRYCLHGQWRRPGHGHDDVIKLAARTSQLPGCRRWRYLGERVTEAFKLILSSDKVRCILINIFGGIVRCDMIAEGIIHAVKEVGLTIPVVVRLEGTNVEKGRELLANSGLKITPAMDLNDAAQKAVAAAK